MSHYCVVVTATAQAHARAVVRWCDENDQSPDTFAAEVASALQRIAALPHSGHLYGERSNDNCYRLLLRHTGYHLYYKVDEPAREVSVRVIWFTGRGKRPDLT